MSVSVYIAGIMAGKDHAKKVAASGKSPAPRLPPVYKPSFTAHQVTVHTDDYEPPQTSYCGDPYCTECEES